MSYAPHSNDVVLQEMINGQIPSPHPLVLGQFRHKETDAVFEFADRRWFNDDHSEFPHIIYMVDGSTRLAKVLKTVTYVVVDEGEFGKPVIEKWPTKQYRPYDTAWVSQKYQEYKAA